MAIFWLKITTTLCLLFYLSLHKYLQSSLRYIYRQIRLHSFHKHLHSCKETQLCHNDELGRKRHLAPVYNGLFLRLDTTMLISKPQVIYRVLIINGLPFSSQVSPVQSSVHLHTNSSPFFSQTPSFLQGFSALSQ